jgi:sugar/nucleoside kinase (ribokinase family)
MNRTRAENAASVLLHYGVRKWIFIHTPEGALAKSREELSFSGSVNLPVDFIKGTTGAGDAFAAGVLLGLHESLSINDCLKRGICAAASCLSHPSCSDGIKSIEECLELGEKYGFRELG